MKTADDRGEASFNCVLCNFLTGTDSEINILAKARTMNGFLQALAMPFPSLTMGLLEENFRAGFLWRWCFLLIWFLKDE